MWKKNDNSSNKIPDQEIGQLSKNADLTRLREPRKFLDNHPGHSHKGKLNFESAGNYSEPLGKPVVVYHESQSNTTSHTWMTKLMEESAQFLAEQRGVQLNEIYRESLLKQGIESLIDRIYGIIQSYCSEFNQVAAGTDLHVSSTISGIVTEAIRYNSLREVEETQTYSRARFSTRLFSLILRGHDDIVEFYIIPTNKIMALSKCENEFSPVATIRAKITDQGMMWRVLDGAPLLDSLEEFAMWLFTNLIQQSKLSAKEEIEASS